MAVREYQDVRQRPIREGMPQAHYQRAYILADNITLARVESF